MEQDKISASFGAGVQDFPANSKSRIIAYDESEVKFDASINDLAQGYNIWIDLNNISNVPRGFLIVLGTMAAIGGILFAFFRQKKWILVQKEHANGSHDGKKKSKVPSKEVKNKNR